MRGRSTAVAAVVGAAVLALSAACGGGGSGSKTELVVYNAQHEDLVAAMLKGFAKETGIDVTLRNGSDFELANQIVQEGSASPADVFLTENSPAMTLVSDKGLFAPVDGDTMAQVPAAYVSSKKDWLGFAARSTVLAYNTAGVPKDQLPASIMDMADPRWKGQVGIAPSGADFQAIVSAVVAVEGQAKAQTWLQGLKTNAKIYRNNVAILSAVNSGEIKTGIIYHYYWYQDQAESGANSKNVTLDFFGHQDPGAFLSTSGAGVLKSSKHAADAQQLVNYLTGKAGQQALVDSNALEYPVGNGIKANAKLKPLSELDPPTVDVGALNGPAVVAMMQQAGLL
ncbi:MAG TPA: iron ABC transporter substrate-binding protein [Mycobacteriales bacterium]|jgi:iron(III) transport system substrate-binding protein|nr:iron ABC transporter substrate-binding protein [Mycobacteriales bacterium]